MKIVSVWDKTEAQWLAEREKGIGGSDAGTIVGVNKYNSPLQLWSEKTHTTPRTFTGNSATKWGHILEPVIAEAYAKDTGKAIVEWPVLIWSGDEETSFMYANLDYVEVEPSEQFPAGKVTVWRELTPPPGILDIVECKTTGVATMGNVKAWLKGKVPESYMVQGYHYVIVLQSIGIKVDHVTFLCFAPGQDPPIIVRGMGKREDDHILWDDNTANDIKIAEEQFWDLVQFKIEPEIDGSDVTEELLAARFPRHVEGKSFEATAEFAKLVELFDAAKKITAQAEKEQKALRSKIVSILGDAESATYQGELLLTFKAGQDRKTFNATAFQEAMPELYAQFVKESPGSRTLLIK